MAHKKGRKGKAKDARIRDVRRYPRKLERCSAEVAPKCRRWFNPNTARKTGVCNRCSQALESKASKKRLQYR